MKRTVLFVYPASFYRKGKLHNFRNILTFFTPHFVRKGFRVLAVSFDNLEDDLSINKKYLSGTDDFDDCRIILVQRKFKPRSLVFKIPNSLYELFTLKKIIKKHRPALVYCYGHELAFLASILKKNFAFLLVTDMRGDQIAELKHKKVSGLKIFLTRSILNRVEKKSDRIFVVSDTYVKKGSQSKYIVRYNYYDERVFHYDEREAVDQKRRLGLADKFVFVYSGTYRYYQMNEETVKFFHDFNKLYPDSFFMVNVSNQPEKFEKLFRKFDVPRDAYEIRSLDQAEINRYQVAADMAFSLREDLPLNHHSFPTKFSEYMAGGVPVLMTPHIHSIAPMVKKHQLGEVIELKDDYSKDFEVIYTKYKNNYEAKKRCARFAQENLSWQKESKDIVDTLLNQLYL